MIKQNIYIYIYYQQLQGCFFFLYEITNSLICEIKQIYIRILVQIILDHFFLSEEQIRLNCMCSLFEPKIIFDHI